MANSRRSRDLSMSKGEIIAGCIYWPIYLLLLAPALTFVLSFLGVEVTDLRVNLCYFITNFLVVAIVFRRYLIASLGQFGRAFWQCAQAVVLGLAFYYLMTWGLSLAFSLLDLTVISPNDQAISGLVSQQSSAMMVCTVLLAPLSEEVLNRGLIFGNLARKNRWLAYVVSTAVFCFLHVFSYLGTLNLPATLLVLLSYAPAGIALGWTMEKAGTVWAPILVHAVINLIATGLMTAF